MDKCLACQAVLPGRGGSSADGTTIAEIAALLSKPRDTFCDFCWYRIWHLGRASASSRAAHSQGDFSKEEIATLGLTVFLRHATNIKDREQAFGERQERARQRREARIAERQRQSEENERRHAIYEEARRRDGAVAAQIYQRHFVNSNDLDLSDPAHISWVKKERTKYSEELEWRREREWLVASEVLRNERGWTGQRFYSYAARRRRGLKPVDAAVSTLHHFLVVMGALSEPELQARVAKALHTLRNVT